MTTYFLSHTHTHRVTKDFLEEVLAKIVYETPTPFIERVCPKLLLTVVSQRFFISQVQG